MLTKRQCDNPYFRREFNTSFLKILFWLASARKSVIQAQFRSDPIAKYFVNQLAETISGLENAVLAERRFRRFIQDEQKTAAVEEEYKSDLSRCSLLNGTPMFSPEQIAQEISGIKPRLFALLEKLTDIPEYVPPQREEKHPEMDEIKEAKPPASVQENDPAIVIKSICKDGAKLSVRLGFLALLIIIILNELKPEIIPPINFYGDHHDLSPVQLHGGNVATGVISGVATALGCQLLLCLATICKFEDNRSVSPQPGVRAPARHPAGEVKGVAVQIRPAHRDDKGPAATPMLYGEVKVGERAPASGVEGVPQRVEGFGLGFDRGSPIVNPGQAAGSVSQPGGRSQPGIVSQPGIELVGVVVDAPPAPRPIEGVRLPSP